MRFDPGPGLAPATNSDLLTRVGVMQVCGNPRVWGDGITPMESAHLEGTATSLYSEWTAFQGRCPDTQSS